MATLEMLRRRQKRRGLEIPKPAPGINVAPQEAGMPVPQQQGGGTNLMGNMMNLASIYARTKGAGGTTGEGLGEPVPGGYISPEGYAMNVGEGLETPGVDFPGEPAQAGTPLMDPWKKPVVGKMPLDQFVMMTGMMAQALAPETWSGRMGGAMSTLAGSVYGERMKREIGAPEAEQKRRLTEAQIKKAERPDIPTTAMGALLRREPEATSERIIEMAQGLKTEPKGPTTAMGAYLQKFPNATADEIAKFSRSLKTTTDKETWSDPKWDEKTKSWIQTSDRGKRFKVAGAPATGAAGKKTETAKQIDFKLFKSLRSITHDKEGKPRGAASARAIENLNKAAAAYGREVVRIPLEGLKKTAFGVDLFAKDVPGQSIYLIVEKGQEQIDPQEIIDTLVTDYQIDEADARKMMMQATGEEPYIGD